MTDENDPMTLTIEEHGDHAVLRPAGYLNALVGDRIEKACLEMIARDTRYFIINFSKVSMVNTIGISLLVSIIEKVLRCNGLVYFTHLSDTESRVFEVLNLSTVALIFRSDDEAKAHMARDKEAALRVEGGRTPSS